MMANGREAAATEPIEDPHCVRVVGELGDVVFVGPAEGCGFVVSVQLAAYDLAAEDQGDDAAHHVLVDAG
jgi:hypothetical protein